MSTQSTKAQHAAARQRLVEYINGTLDGVDHAAVRRHLSVCSACRSDEAAWRAVAAAATAVAAAPPAPALMLERVFADLAGGAGSAQRTAAGRGVPRPAVAAAYRARHVVAVLSAQLHVVRRSLWTASAVVFFVGSLVVAGGAVDAGRAFALLAPLIAAVGVSLVCGPSVDPRLEVALSTATSPRLVLLFAFDLGLAVAASAGLVAAHRGGGLWTLVTAWLGPMLLLTSLSLAVSVITRRATLGVTVGFALWALRVIALRPGVPMHGELSGQVVATLWSTTLPTVALAGALLAAAVLLARPEARA